MKNLFLKDLKRGEGNFGKVTCRYEASASHASTKIRKLLLPHNSRWLLTFCIIILFIFIYCRHAKDLRALSI